MSSLIYLLLSLTLLGFSALFSGLTLGLFSLSVFELRRKADLGDAEAKLVYPIRARGNELLVSLLTGNVLVNAALTISLDNLMPGTSPIWALVTVVVATILITFFGEILPQSYFKLNALRFCAMISPYLDKFLEFMRPFSGRVGYFLDQTVGKDAPTVYSNDELVKILEEHEKSEDSTIEKDELEIVRNVLSFGDKLVHDVMTPKSVVTVLEQNEQITAGLLDKLHKSGHSRFPVYDENINDIVGILYLRDLVDSSKHSKTVKQAMNKRVFYVNDSQALDHALNAIIRTKHHLFIVVNEYKETVGIITIEDIIEEIMGREIVDEFDRYDDMREVAALQAKKVKRRGKMVSRKPPKI